MGVERQGSRASSSRRLHTVRCQTRNAQPGPAREAIGRVSLQDLGLGARRVVFGQFRIVERRRALASYRNSPGWRAASPISPPARCGGTPLGRWFRGDRRPARCRSSEILCQAQSAEHPACVRRKEVAIGCADMVTRRHHATAAQHRLVGHEFAVVFADRTRRFAITRIGDVGAGGPLPTSPIICCGPPPAARPDAASRPGGCRRAAGRRQRFPSDCAAGACRPT